MNRIKEFIHEIHRRSLWQVLGIFLASSWGVLQAVEFVTDFAGLPDWTPAMALVLLMIGLPICLATAFVQEGMPGQDAASEATESPAPATAEDAPSGGPGATPSDALDAAPSEARHLLTWRNAILGGIGAFALLGFSLIAYFVMWTTGIGPVGSLVAQGVLEERDPVLLAEFDNRTDDETLGAVITDALRVDLLESQVVTLVDDRLVGETLTRMGLDQSDRLTGELAREVAIREGIKAVVQGDVSRVGTGYLLSAEIVAADDGASLAAFRETAEDDAGLLPAIDDLSQKLRERAGESLRDIRSAEPLEAVTTSSLEALRLYGQGTRAFGEGEIQAAIGFLEAAVEVDSTFAMAWRKLAVSYSNLGLSPILQTEAASAAYRHRARLTERERLLAEAYYHDQVTLDREAEAEAYRRVLELHPDEPTALNNLAVHYGDRGDWSRARELYTRAVTGPGRSITAYRNLGLATFNDGDPEAGLSTLQEAFERYPSDVGNPVRQVPMVWALGRPDEAITLARETIEAFPDSYNEHRFLLRNIARIEESRGRLASARRALEELRALAMTIDQPFVVLQSEQSLMRIDLAEGRDTLAAARRVDDRFQEIFGGRQVLGGPYRIMAAVWTTAGDIEEAQRYSDLSLEAFPEEARGSSLYDEVVVLVEGYKALVGGEYATSLENFREVARRQNNCDDCYLTEIADSFDGLQQPDSAIVYVERFFDLTNFDLVSDQEQQAADRLEQLARLYEEVGRDAEAAEAWARLADRWVDADAVLQPRVRAARANAARLVGGAASGGN